MKKIKLFLEFVSSNQSQFIPSMTITELAKEFGKTTDYILEFETYLKMLVENGNHAVSAFSVLKDYKFHLEENYPSYLEEAEF